MEYIIKNKFLTAKIASLGAELISLVDENGLERMHVANPDNWNSTSPILFPQVSRFKDFTYRVKGKEYKMPMHGFFRNEELTPIASGKNYLTFAFEDNEKTLLMYPYHFYFEVNYRLVGKSLTVSFNVTNKNNYKMRYMLGGHPGFKVPLLDNENYEDYYLKFPRLETCKAMQVVKGYLANVYKKTLNHERVINLKHDLFVPDAIVLRGLKSKYVDIVSKTNDYKTRFHFSDFEILAIWSLNKDNANYVCLEPWNGIQKHFVKDYERMGVLSLKAKESKTFSYKIEIKN